MKIKLAIISVALFYSTHSFAFFCPNNFNSINFGDTIEQVQAQCGKPTSEKSYKSEGNVPQEWTFYIPASTTSTLGVPVGSSPPGPGTTTANQGSMKVTVAFVNNQVANITSNGIGVGATTVCRNQNIQIGSSMQDVKTACGKPVMIVNTNIAGENAQGTPPSDIVEWKYEGNTTATLTFENGKLKERK